MNRFASLSIIAVVTSFVFFLSGCTSTDTSTDGSANAEIENADETARGREQLIRAFDAAWVRVIASGKQREIMDSEPPNDPGLSNTYVVRMADCLPLPDLTPFPEEPVGLLKTVIETGQLRRLIQDVPNTNKDSSYFFSTLSEKILQAMLEEMGNHYGVTITYTDIAATPGRLASTSYLIDDEVDFVSQLNATGGRTQNLRRRVSRRFSCTLTAATQFIHVPEKSQLASEINSLNDLMDRTDVRICAGPLTTQTAKAFLPDHKVTTRYISDIAECDARVKGGKADVIMNPIPDLNMADIDGYKTVPTLIVAGTPLWVAQEGIACDIAPARANGEPECREIDPL
jgi:hypothetical protein